MGVEDTSPDPGRRLLPALAAMPGHLLWRAAARVQRVLAETLPPTADIHAYAALTLLGDGTPRSQQHLAVEVGTSRTTLGKVAARLVEAGLVERVRNPEDRRSYLLTRTPAGADTAAAWDGPVAEVDRRVSAPFTEAESADLRALLVRVLDLDDTVAPVLRGNLGLLLERAHAATSPQFSAGLAPLGIEPRHFGALQVLSSLGPLPQSSVAGWLGFSPASGVALTDELEERGLLVRRRSESDRRVHELHLTPAAGPVVEGARTLAARVVHDLFAELDDAETARLVGYLRRVVTDA
ncbi:MarR family transcriptional regulator [Nocardioides sp. GY 10127]|uniref:MarR family winged helix-turn-helix transcriptional regulator n=1 Tax=Nocardioides sp. GY 10127 TaxID=2569762 RepID=UPI0014584F57|nr:MarR family transcriptional regulator [Nocardioides sp. GY 10127]